MSGTGTRNKDIPAPVRTDVQIMLQVQPNKVPPRAEQRLAMCLGPRATLDWLRVVTNPGARVCLLTTLWLTRKRGPLLRFSLYFLVPHREHGNESEPVLERYQE